MAEELEESASLDKYLEFVRNLDLDKLKYELSSELGPLSGEVLDELEAERIPPRIKVRVSENGMEAFLNVVHPGKPRSVSLDLLQEQLKANPVVSGIIEDHLERIVDRQIYDQEVLVARGKLPESGKDGFITVLVNKSEDPEDFLDARGRVDFKRMRLKNMVHKGEVIAERVLAVPGIDGYLVTGKPLPARAVKEAEFKLTPDVGLAPDNELKLLALKDGVFFPDFRIRDINIIDGNISYATGNVRYEKSLIVKGDVKSGFSVECGENVDVYRCVEDAEIIAGGDVIVKEGFLGTGKGIIRAKNVTIGHIKQQRVEARENIVVGGEVMYCNLVAGGIIKVMGIKGIVIGGTLIAEKGIEVANAGNTQNVKTHLCVGYNKAVIAMDQKLIEIEQYLDKVTRSIRIFRAVGHLDKLSANTRGKLQLLIKTRDAFTEEIGQLKITREKELMTIVEHEKPTIKVTGTVFSGATIQIGDLKNYVTKEIRNKIFITHKGKIVEVAASSLSRGKKKDNP